jgi:hypothetical protein
MHEEDRAANAEEVAEILRQLKGAVGHSRHRRAIAVPGAGDEDRTSLWQSAVDGVYSAAHVNPHLPIAWPDWPKGLGPKIVAFTQKVLRRLLRWYINPIVEQQNRFNVAVAQALDVLGRELDRLQAHPSQENRESEPAET